MKPYECVRIVQIMPADGWWFVWGADPMFRTRVVGFALIDVWMSRSVTTEYEPDDECNVSREVRPLDVDGDAIDIQMSDNMLGLVHDDEWTQEESGFLKRAAEYLAKERAKR